MFFNQACVETIVPSGNWSVGGENHFAGNAGHGLFKGQPFFLHPAGDGFEHCKSAVTFVQMQHAGRYAHSLQRAESTDPEQQLLANAHAAVAAIQARSEFAVLGSITLDIRIKKQQVAPAHLHPPDFGANNAAAGYEIHFHGLAIFADGRLHGKLIDVSLEVLLLLPAVAIQALAEVALAVEQSNADQGNVQVRRALDMVSRKNAQAARVNR